MNRSLEGVILKKDKKKGVLSRRNLRRYKKSKFSSFSITNDRNSSKKKVGSINSLPSPSRTRKLHPNLEIKSLAKLEAFKKETSLLRQSMTYDNRMNSQRSDYIDLNKLYARKLQKTKNQRRHHISINVESKKSWKNLSKSRESLRAMNPYEDVVSFSDFMRNKSLDKSSNVSSSSLSSFTDKYNFSVSNQLKKWSDKRGKARKYTDVNAEVIFNKVKHQIAIAQSYSKNKEHIKIDSMVKKHVDLVPEIPVYCKIPCKDEYSPCKITLVMDSERGPDIYAYSSLRFPMPSASKCSRSWKNSKVLKVSYNYEELHPHEEGILNRSYKSTTSLANQFSNHFVYLTLLSYTGASMIADVKFANELGTFGNKKFAVTKESEDKKALEALRQLKQEREEEELRCHESDFKVPHAIQYLNMPYEVRKSYANEKKHKLFIQKITKIEVNNATKKLHQRLQRLAKIKKVCANVIVRQLYLQKYILYFARRYKESLPNNINSIYFKS
ncbi:unnamed protein product [Moneuplotes crassus]|uniref:Uncharacterized protein n=1 Tax=Euplotes crassus TaxID=5936 RepID=A0AAD1U9W1_EUPCR|nr:unnamed protein product [Moneuplotes crassus]